MTNSSYRTLTAGLIAAWFAFAIVASALHIFETSPDRPPLPLLLAVGVPIVLFSLWYSSSRGFRDFVLSLSPRTLTMVQSWRIAGYVFLVLYTYGILPGSFALPAGWGDMFIGATALIVAGKVANPNCRKTFITWQLLGVTDLVVAVSSGAFQRIFHPAALAGSSVVNTGPMTVLPLSLIPTFGVPLFLILHIICVAQARRWSVLEPKCGSEELKPITVRS
ncbi:MAG TPA: hypothetical protein VKW78_05615 [Terriglobales bacterium]|nr:hypothetical protein [Terriglobales bacterium]